MHDTHLSGMNAAPKKLLIFIALIQGLLLLWLHQAIDLKFWPHASPEFLFSFYSLALPIPIILLLSLHHGDVIRQAKYIGVFALVAALLGYYIGLQVEPLEYIRVDSLITAYVITMFIATFKVLMYMQQWNSGEAFSYSRLYRWSWRNFLTLALSLLFALCIWGVLMLWAALFKAINIRFFYDVFTEAWFYYPALALANGFGVIIFRRLSHIIDTITRLQQALMTFLLVALVFVSLLFLVALPFSGLQALWDSGGSMLILWMQAIILFTVNAVYQDEPDKHPYNKWVHRFIYLGVALLVVYSAISFYGLSLRIGQYGWSISRAWGVLIWLLLTVFSLSYLWGILRLRDRWLEHVSRVNVVLGLVVLVFMLITNTPILDFRKIVANDQLDRLASSKMAIDDLELRYFRRHLARPGYSALQQIKKVYGDEHPNIVIRIDSLYSKRTTEQPLFTKEEYFNSLEVLDDPLPESLVDSLYQRAVDNRWLIENVTSKYIFTEDLNDDGSSEYILVEKQRGFSYLYVFLLESNEWKYYSLTRLGSYRALDKTFIDHVKKQNVDTITPRWNHLRIGEHTFRVDQAN